MVHGDLDLTRHRHIWEMIGEGWDESNETAAGEDVRSNDDEETEICFKAPENCFVSVHRNLRMAWLSFRYRPVTSPFSSLQASSPRK